MILTHGHFDHVGSIEALLERWPVPMFAHPLEFPFLTGREAYPGQTASAVSTLRHAEWASPDDSGASSPASDTYGYRLTQEARRHLRNSQAWQWTMACPKRS